jgi:hypothetical protein
MGYKTQEFVNLVNQALEVAEQILPESGERERLNNVVMQLQYIRTQAQNGQLAPSEGNTTLGLAREVSDWIANLDSPFLSAIGAIEQYYQKNL